MLIQARAVKLPVVMLVTLLGGACGGGSSPGTTCGRDTHLEGSACVADPPVPPKVQPTDALIIGPPGAPGGGGLLLGVNTVACLDLQLLHDDGTLSPLGSGSGTVELTSGNPTAATPAAPTDCPFAGVIGLAPGKSSLRVRVTTPSGTFEGATPVQVDSGTLNLELRATTVVPGEQPFKGLVANLTASLPWYVHPVPRWITLQTADPSIATLARGSTPGTFTVRGLTRGKTQVSGTYGPEGLAKPIDAVELTVLGPIQSVTAVSIELLKTSTGEKLETYPAIPPGTCFSAQLVGKFTDDQGNVHYGPVSSGVSWASASSTVTVSGAPTAQVCATGRGDAVLKGCVGASCATTAFSIYESGAVKSIAAAFGSSAAVRHQYQPYNMVCPDLKFLATFADSTTRDVTDSLSVSYSRPVINSVTRLIVDGVPYRDGAGRPCFEASNLPVGFNSAAIKVHYVDQWKELSFAVMP